MKKILFPVAICISSFSCNPEKYTGIAIGDLVWMSENLSVTRFRNGDEIPQAKTSFEWMKACTSGQPAWSYPMNNPGNDDTYGKLYNWSAVSDPRGIAPEGWHVPTDDEWKELTEYLGGEILAAYRLRTTTIGSEQTSESGFSGLPAGGCRCDGTFMGFGSKGYWWTSTGINEELAWMRQLDYVQGGINSIAYAKQSGLSVRCVQDRRNTLQTPDF